ncbi:MAG: hypothetical protein QOD26_2640 [Betaproteobacteria bacterium]|jgi:hypothetical protein|nr:hypothetical protein [Betaproteobacteria bacterium]
MYSPQLLPSLLGASSSIAFTAFFGTLLFNVYTWLFQGGGLSLEEAVANAPASPIYTALSVATSIAAGILGGMAAANLSTRTPYANSLTSALVVLVWSLVLFASPLRETKADTLGVIEAFGLPIPCALLGAYVIAWARRS